MKVGKDRGKDQDWGRDAPRRGLLFLFEISIAFLFDFLKFAVGLITSFDSLPVFLFAGNNLFNTETAGQETSDGPLFLLPLTLT